MRSKALLQMIGFGLVATAVAQPPDAAVEVAETETETDPQIDHVDQIDQLDQLDQLESDVRERNAQLESALERIDALEQNARDAQAAEEARLAAEAEEEQSAWTIRPLVSSFVRLEVREGYDALGVSPPACNGGDGDCFRWRARLGLDVGVDLSDRVNARARFLPEFAGFWASVPGFSGGVTDPSIGLHEGSLLLQVGETFGVELGRFEMVYGEHVVIGNLGWHPSARSFDGGRLLLRTGGVAIDAFFTVLNESRDSAPGRSDSYFYGVYAKLGGLIDEGTALDVYVLGLQTNNSFDPSLGVPLDWSQRTHIGARFKKRLGVLDLRAEGGLQIGRQGMPDPVDAELIVAGHALAEVGVNLADDVFRISVEGAYASGDDPDTSKIESYDQLFPTAHAFLGLADVMGGRSNVGTAVLHAQLKPMSTLLLSLDGHLFTRPQNAGDAYWGFETDLNVIWKPLPGLRARAMVGVFVPNEDVWGDDEVVRYVEVEVGWDFR